MESRGGHEVEQSNDFCLLYRVPPTITTMIRFLSEITEKHIEIISQAIHDTYLEYDRSHQDRLCKIGERLRDNHSMYQLSSEELDVLCMCLNDCLYVLDDCMRDLDDEVDLRDCREDREAVEDILSILQQN